MSSVTDGMGSGETKWETSIKPSENIKLSAQKWSRSSKGMGCDGVVVSGSEDQALKLWRVTYLKNRKGNQSEVTSDKDKGKKSQPYGRSQYTCVHTLKGHTGGVHCCWISPCGLTIVSGSGDNTVRVWNACRGVCTRIFSHS